MLTTFGPPKQYCFGHREPIQSLSVSPCGRYLAAISPSSVALWSNEQHRVLLSFTKRETTQTSADTQSSKADIFGSHHMAVWSPSSSHLFVSTVPGRSLCVYRILATRRGHEGEGDESEGLLDAADETTPRFQSRPYMVVQQPPTHCGTRIELHMVLNLPVLVSWMAASPRYLIAACRKQPAIFLLDYSDCRSLSHIVYLTPFLTDTALGATTPHPHHGGHHDPTVGGTPTPAANVTPSSTTRSAFRPFDPPAHGEALYDPDGAECLKRHLENVQQSRTTPMLKSDVEAYPPPFGSPLPFSTAPPQADQDHPPTNGLPSHPKGHRRSSYGGEAVASPPTGIHHISVDTRLDLVGVVLNSGAAMVFAWKKPFLYPGRRRNNDDWRAALLRGGKGGLGVIVRATGATQIEFNAAQNMMAVALASGVVELIDIPKLRECTLERATSGRDTTPPPTSLPAYVVRQLNVAEAIGLDVQVSEMGGVVTMQWSSDGRALVVGYRRVGWAIFSYLGKPLAAPFRRPEGKGPSAPFPSSQRASPASYLQYTRRTSYAYSFPYGYATPELQPSPPPAHAMGTPSAAVLPPLSQSASATPTHGGSAYHRAISTQSILSSWSRGVQGRALCWGSHGMAVLVAYQGEDGVLYEFDIFRSADWAPLVSLSPQAFVIGHGQRQKRGLAEGWSAKRTYAPIPPQSLSGACCSADLNHMVLVGPHRFLVCEALPWEPSHPQWTSIPLPPALYTCPNWPLQLAAISPDADWFLAAGRRGAAVYHMKTRRWQLFGNVQHEAALKTIGLAWYDSRTFFLTYAQDSSTAAEMQRGASSGDVSAPQTPAANPPSPSATAPVTYSIVFLDPSLRLDLDLAVAKIEDLHYMPLRVALLDPTHRLVPSMNLSKRLGGGSARRQSATGSSAPPRGPLLPRLPRDDESASPVSRRTPLLAVYDENYEVTAYRLMAFADSVTSDWLGGGLSRAKTRSLTVATLWKVDFKALMWIDHPLSVRFLVDQNHFLIHHAGGDVTVVHLRVGVGQGDGEPDEDDEGGVATGPLCIPEESAPLVRDVDSLWTGPAGQLPEFCPLPFRQRRSPSPPATRNNNSNSRPPASPAPPAQDDVGTPLRLAAISLPAKQDNQDSDLSPSIAPDTPSSRVEVAAAQPKAAAAPPASIDNSNKPPVAGTSVAGGGRVNMTEARRIQLDHQDSIDGLLQPSGSSISLGGSSGPEGFVPRRVEKFGGWVAEIVPDDIAAGETELDYNTITVYSTQEEGINRTVQRYTLMPLPQPGVVTLSSKASPPPSSVSRSQGGAPHHHPQSWWFPSLGLSKPKPDASTDLSDRESSSVPPPSPSPTPPPSRAQLTAVSSETDGGTAVAEDDNNETGTGRKGSVDRKGGQWQVEPRGEEATGGKRCDESNRRGSIVEAIKAKGTNAQPSPSFFALQRRGISGSDLGLLYSDLRYGSADRGTVAGGIHDVKYYEKQAEDYRTLLRSQHQRMKEQYDTQHRSHELQGPQADLDTCRGGIYVWCQNTEGLQLITVAASMRNKKPAAGGQQGHDDSAAPTPPPATDDGVRDSVDPLEYRTASLLPIDQRPHPVKLLAVLPQVGVLLACSPANTFPTSPTAVPSTSLQLQFQPFLHPLLKVFLATAPPLASTVEVPSPSFQVAERLLGFLEPTNAFKPTLELLFHDILEEAIPIYSSHHRKTQTRIQTTLAFPQQQQQQQERDAAPDSSPRRSVSSHVMQLGSPLLPSRGGVGEIMDDASPRGNGYALVSGGWKVRPTSILKMCCKTSSVFIMVEVALTLLKRFDTVMPEVLIALIRKTEPFTTPLILFPLGGVHPHHLFSLCVERHQLSVASLYLVVLQNLVGPLRVRADYALRLFEKALHNSAFTLAKNILHFFRSLFVHSSPVSATHAPDAVESQQHSDDETLTDIIDTSGGEALTNRSTAVTTQVTEGAGRGNHGGHADTSEAPSPSLSAPDQGSAIVADLPPLARARTAKAPHAPAITAIHHSQRLWRPVRDEQAAPPVVAADSDGIDRYAAARVFVQFQSVLSDFLAESLIQLQWLRVLSAVVTLRLDLLQWLMYPRLRRHLGHLISISGGGTGAVGKQSQTQGSSDDEIEAGFVRSQLEWLAEVATALVAQFQLSGRVVRLHLKGNRAPGLCHTSHKHEEQATDAAETSASSCLPGHFYYPSDCALQYLLHVCWEGLPVAALLICHCSDASMGGVGDKWESGVSEGSRLLLSSHTRLRGALRNLMTRVRRVCCGVGHAVNDGGDVAEGGRGEEGHESSNYVSKGRLHLSHQALAVLSWLEKALA
ncbi:unnamed protein product [Vitrella brassicaformis CCMP3155]|uniref:RIC1 C-terminal alpha solenoid region domain-containing protein n=4 Tax=Vitrella brassicaformis TaxID=1169539 RepID=A0A0G4GHQ6_VITBC|nr:unnamed protein product [Vitrella brassicaformis CCMP3155]|eukprot:CEM29259.1 unnamed protein product [Vitrella brassicaformis CCMP3155]